MGPSSFYFLYAGLFPKKEHYLAVLWKTFLLSWTCSCTVLWHYIKLSCIIRHLDLFYFTHTCCQPLFLAKYGAQPKTNYCSCFGFKCPDQCDFQFSSVLAKCQVHQPYYKFLKTGVCNGSADTGLNIGMNNIIIIMEGEMSKKDMIVEHSKRAVLINHLIHLRKLLWKRKG